MHTIPYLNLEAQNELVKDEITDIINATIVSGRFIDDNAAEVLESALKSYTGASDVAACSSGTSALVMALMACNITTGDQVITTAHSFIATTEAIVTVGATPIFVDITETYHIDATKIEASITPNTKAILFVDIYGQQQDVLQLRAIANKHNIVLIQDSAQSFGSTHNNHQIGSIADLACVSFNPLKPLGAIGSGGAVFGDNYLIEQVKQIRNHGKDTHGNNVQKGITGRIDTIQALTVVAKLAHFDTWTEQRRAHCKRFTQEIDNPLVKVPIQLDNSLHTFYAYVVAVENREAFVAHLAEHNIATRIQYRTPIHHHPVYQQYQTTELPNTELAAQTVVSIPCDFTLTDCHISYIIKIINLYS